MNYELNIYPDIQNFLANTRNEINLNMENQNLKEEEMYMYLYFGLE